MDVPWDWVRKRAAGEEAKTLRSVNLRQQMDSALKEKVAEKEAKEQKEAAAPPEFSPAAIAKMDAATLRHASGHTRSISHAMHTNHYMYFCLELRQISEVYTRVCRARDGERW